MQRLKERRIFVKYEIDMIEIEKLNDNFKN